ncbi:ABC-F family ATP-binding cassette domain-containing protein [Leucobacter albus]|uniref:ABC-F family ATP-binding cassette domain-containing protein n=1 Tax=Leucobacter albus TaxID=272210 RepID=A0ABW3TJV9_9MICO
MHTSPTAATHLKFEGVSQTFGARRVLTDISFTVAAGSRVGLIGENGSGKSTLLRIAGGIDQPAGGSAVAVTPGATAARVALLHQEQPFAPSHTIEQALRAATAPVRAALDELDRAGAALAGASNGLPSTEHSGLHPASAERDYSAALDNAERLDAWQLDATVEQMLAGLGIAELPRDRLTGELSGGQRARLGLAWVLLNVPDVLLLDEPTNHLDDSATEYLVRVLQRQRSPVLFASHDRAFLDEAATALVDLDPAPQPEMRTAPLVQDGTGSGIGITRFGGNFSEYLAARAAARVRWEEQFAAEQSELRRLRAAVGTSHTVGHEEWKPRTETRMAQKFYADRNAKVVSRRVNDARSRLEALAARQISEPPAELTFAGIRGARDTNDDGPAIVATGAAVAGRLAPVTVCVETGKKLLVTGPNGAGKSTLLGALTGSIALTAGELRLPGAPRVGLLRQHTEFADPSGRGTARTVSETYVDGVRPELAEAVPLSQFGLIAARDESQPLGALSVGQRRRLALAILLAEPPELLLLDEPTNHLSLALADALERAVMEFTGTVVVASHDRWLRRRWAGEELRLEPGKRS